MLRRQLVKYVFSTCSAVPLLCVCLMGLAVIGSSYRKAQQCEDEMTFIRCISPLKYVNIHQNIDMFCIEDADDGLLCMGHYSSQKRDNWMPTGPLSFEQFCHLQCVYQTAHSFWSWCFLFWWSQCWCALLWLLTFKHPFKQSEEHQEIDSL